MPLYGHELSESLTPFDASLGSVVGLDKPEFVGREALVERAGRRGAEGTTVLVALAGQGRRAARAGSAVFDAAGRRVGAVTSGLLSPTLGHPIALALVSPASPQAPDWPVGAQLSADVRGRMLPMSVVASPFYRRGR